MDTVSACVNGTQAEAADESMKRVPSAGAQKIGRCVVAAAVVVIL